MHEGAPKIPEPANENAPVGEQDDFSSAEKADMLAEAKEVWEELKQYDHQEVDRETYDRIKKLEMWMHNKIVLKAGLGVDDLQKVGVWSPRIELVRQQYQQQLQNVGYRPTDSYE